MREELGPEKIKKPFVTLVCPSPIGTPQPRVCATLRALATSRMSSKEGESKDDKAALKDDARVQQLTARLVKLLEIKVGLDKMAKSLADPENSCVLSCGMAGAATRADLAVAGAGSWEFLTDGALTPPPARPRSPTTPRPRPRPQREGQGISRHADDACRLFF